MADRLSPELTRRQLVWWPGPSPVAAFLHERHSSGPRKQRPHQRPASSAGIGALPVRRVAFDAPAGVGVIRREQALMSGRAAVPALVGLRPPLDDLPPDRGQPPRPERGGRVVDRLQQRVAIAGEVPLTGRRPGSRHDARILGMSRRDRGDRGLLNHRNGRDPRGRAVGAPARSARSRAGAATLEPPSCGPRLPGCLHRAVHAATRPECRSSVPATLPDLVVQPDLPVYFVIA